MRTSFDAGRRALPVGVDSPANPPPDIVDGLEQDPCHPLPEMYAMPEGEEWPPTARDGVLSDGEPVQRTAYTEVGSCEWECRSGAHES